MRLRPLDSLSRLNLKPDRLDGTPLSLHQRHVRIIGIYRILLLRDGSFVKTTPSFVVSAPTLLDLYLR